MSELNKETLKAAFHEVFYLEDFEPTDADVKMVSHIMSVESKSALDVLDEYIRLDSKTKRLMHRGWIIFGSYYYENDQDALKTLQEHGVAGFHELDGEDGESYHTDWWEGEIPD